MKRRGLTDNEWWDGVEIVGRVFYERLTLTLVDRLRCLLILHSDSLHTCVVFPPEVVRFLFATLPELLLIRENHSYTYFEKSSAYFRSH